MRLHPLSNGLEVGRARRLIDQLHTRIEWGGRRVVEAKASAQTKSRQHRRQMNAALNVHGSPPTRCSRIPQTVFAHQSDHRYRVETSKDVIEHSRRCRSFPSRRFSGLDDLGSWVKLNPRWGALARWPVKSS